MAYTLSAQGRWLPALIALLAGAAQASDISILGTYTSGDFGNTVDSTIRSTWVRFAAGDRYQFRVAVPYLQIETTDVLVQSVFGAVPVSRGGGQGHGADSGRDGGGRDDSDMSGQTGMPEPLPTSEHDGSTTILSSTSASGVGDLWLSGFVRLLGGNAKVYRMDAGLEVKAPTADEERLLGTGMWDYRLAVSGQYRFWTALTFATLGWNQLGDPDWVELNDALDLVVGGESDPLWNRFVVTGWFEGNQEVIDGIGDRAALGVGLRSLGRFRWRVLATAGLGGSAEDFSVAFGLSMGVEPPKTGLGGIGL